MTIIEDDYDYAITLDCSLSISLEEWLLLLWWWWLLSCALVKNEMSLFYKPLTLLRFD